MHTVESYLLRCSTVELEHIVQKGDYSQRILKHAQNILDKRRLLDFLCTQKRLEQMSNEDLEALLRIVLEMDDMVGIENIVRSIVRVFRQRDAAEETAQMIIYKESSQR